jgi:hypothetical protein
MAGHEASLSTLLISREWSSPPRKALTTAGLVLHRESRVRLYPNAFRIGDNDTAEVLPDEESFTEEQRHVVVESCPEPYS